MPFVDVFLLSDGNILRSGQKSLIGTVTVLVPIHKHVIIIYVMYAVLITTVYTSLIISLDIAHFLVSTLILHYITLQNFLCCSRQYDPA